MWDGGWPTAGGSAYLLWGVTVYLLSEKVRPSVDFGGRRWAPPELCGSGPTASRRLRRLKLRYGVCHLSCNTAGTTALVSYSVRLRGPPWFKLFRSDWGSEISALCEGGAHNERGWGGESDTGPCGPTTSGREGQRGRRTKRTKDKEDAIRWRCVGRGRPDEWPTEVGSTLGPELKRLQSRFYGMASSRSRGFGPGIALLARLPCRGVKGALGCVTTNGRADGWPTEVGSTCWGAELKRVQSRFCGRTRTPGRPGTRRGATHAAAQAGPDGSDWRFEISESEREGPATGERMGRRSSYRALRPYYERSDWGVGGEEVVVEVVEGEG